MSHVLAIKCNHCNENIANVDFAQLFDKFFDYQINAIGSSAQIKLLPKYESISEVLDFIWNNNIPAVATEKHKEHEITAE